MEWKGNRAFEKGIERTPATRDPLPSTRDPLPSTRPPVTLHPATRYPAPATLHPPPVTRHPWKRPAVFYVEISSVSIK